jgi:hypothetical protein
MSIKSALERLQADIHALNEPESSVVYMQRLNFMEVGGHFHIEFYGDPSGAGYSQAVEKIAKTPISSAIASIRLSGPDIGANGTKNWCLTPLADSPAIFANLRHLSIEQIQPADHNRTVIGDIYEEDGVIAKISRKAPGLTELTIPSAPNSEFFDVKLESLAYLNVDAGYDTQNFILNLSQSAGFPSLRCLQWGEFCETYTKDWRESCTPFHDYQALFRAEAFRSVKCFIFKNPVCSVSELAELQSIRPDLQILVVRCSQEYLRRA